MNQPKQQMNVSLKDTSPLSCEKCSGEVFSEGLLLKKVSRFLVGSDKDAIMPIQVLFCANCKHVNEEFMPKEK
jgi:hypothetical protein